MAPYTWTAPKCLPWTVLLHNFQAYKAHLTTTLDTRQPAWSIDEVSTAMQQLLNWGKGVPKAHVRARTSHTEERLRQDLQAASTNAERRQARTRLHQAADKINREKDVSQGTCLLHHLRDGGWGAP